MKTAQEIVGEAFDEPLRAVVEAVVQQGLDEGQRDGIEQSIVVVANSADMDAALAILKRKLAALDPKQEKLL